MSASKQLKTLAEENPLIIKSRHAAKMKIALATKKICKCC